MRGKKPPLYERLLALQSALRRLTTEQGPRARKNARDAVRVSTRRMLKDMDLLYAAPPRKVVARRTLKRLTAEKRGMRLHDEGWEKCPTLLIPSFLSAGVTPLMCDGEAWVPGWCWMIWKKQPKKLRAAVANSQLRKALVTEIALMGTSQEAP